MDLENKKLRPSIKPNSKFENDGYTLEKAKDFKRAFRGLGTDEYRLIKLLSEHSNSQLQDISKKYSEEYNNDLTDDLKDELMGSFEDLCVSLLTPRRLWDAQYTKKALQNIGTNEVWLTEIICARTAEEMEDLKTAYAEIHETPLEYMIKSDTSGPNQKLMLGLLEGKRSQSNEVNEAEAEEDAKALYDNGEGTNSDKNEEVFINILVSKSWCQLRATFNQFEHIAEMTIERSLDNQFSGDICTAFKTIVAYARDPLTYWAERLHSTLCGKDEDDESFFRLLIQHSETDLDSIKDIYDEIYEKRLIEDIKSEFSGCVRKLLVRITDPTSSVRDN
ncbi:DgyrCDS2407 [Dimorphilus gyrociliatus]|uniref:Annexin n=1 Tax=Dimorphilus gyrociliatus TaxID=2664684 RepID=A0A7I8VD02_9ANNE|nr:DgyrCDS2407 [Dimorphilus gyrociliatus]